MAGDSILVTRVVIKVTNFQMFLCWSRQTKMTNMIRIFQDDEEDEEH